MTKISNNDIARAIYLSSKDKSTHELVIHNRNVLNFLYRKHLLSRSNNILAKLEEIINRENHIQIVRLKTREKLKEHTRHLLESFLKKRYKAEEIVFKENINDEWLGGVRIEAGDEIIDLTVKNKIKKLQEHLIRSKAVQTRTI